MLCNSISNNNKHISSSKDIGVTPNKQQQMQEQYKSTNRCINASKCHIPSIHLLKFHCNAVCKKISWVPGMSSPSAYK